MLTLKCVRDRKLALCCRLDCRSQGASYLSHITDLDGSEGGIELSSRTTGSRELKGQQQSIGAASNSSAVVKFILFVAGLALLFWVIFACVRGGPARERLRLAKLSLPELQQETTTSATNELALCELSTRFEAQQKNKEAMDGYFKAVQLNVDDTEAWTGWARTTAIVIGPSQGLQVLDEHRKHASLTAVELRLKGTLLQKSGDLRGATATIAEACNSDPGNVVSWQLAGESSAAQLDYSAAEQAYRHATALKPDDWHLQVCLGDCCSNLVKRNEAIGCFKKAVSLASNEPIPHLLLGMELLRAATNPSDLTAAQQELITASASLPSTAVQPQSQLRVALAESYRRSGEPAKSIAWYRSAQEVSQLDPAIPYGLAAASRAVGDKAGAGAALKQHQALVQYDHSLRVLRDRITAQPRDQASRLKLAELYASRRLYSQAIGLYSDALKQDPNNQIAATRLSRLQAEAGNLPSPLPPPIVGGTR